MCASAHAKRHHLKPLYSLGCGSGLPTAISEIHFDTHVCHITKAGAVPDSVADHIVDHAWREGTKRSWTQGPGDG